ncbi:hypothetical protein QJS66_17955 [Kocuria rhizophila]|nr:hypothetical protein QJS66_17955 [Kocuria rhizophila]
MYNLRVALTEGRLRRLTTLSGAVIAGALMWLVVRALCRPPGCCGALASGATRRR